MDAGRGQGAPPTSLEWRPRNAPGFLDDTALAGWRRPWGSPPGGLATTTFARRALEEGRGLCAVIYSAHHLRTGRAPPRGSSTPGACPRAADVMRSERRRAGDKFTVTLGQLPDGFEDQWIDAVLRDRQAGCRPIGPFWLSASGYAPVLPLLLRSGPGPLSLASISAALTTRYDFRIGASAPFNTRRDAPAMEVLPPN